MELFWCVCGPDLANMSGPPKCHQSVWQVYQRKMWGDLLSEKKSDADLFLIQLTSCGQLLAQKCASLSADVWPWSGSYVAHMWHPGAVRLSAVNPCGKWARWKWGMWARIILPSEMSLVWICSRYGPHLVVSFWPRLGTVMSFTSGWLVANLVWM